MYSFWWLCLSNSRLWITLDFPALLMPVNTVRFENLKSVFLCDLKLCSNRFVIIYFPFQSVLYYRIKNRMAIENTICRTRSLRQITSESPHRLYQIMLQYWGLNRQVIMRLIIQFSKGNCYYLKICLIYWIPRICFTISSAKIKINYECGFYYSWKSANLYVFISQSSTATIDIKIK